MSFKIEHIDGSHEWTAFRRVPPTGLLKRWKSGAWKCIGTYPSEKKAQATIQLYADPLMFTEYYDEHGNRDTGDGW
jgi:hypothetical protein